MTDIVEILDIESRGFGGKPWAAEAAAEIERLRTERDIWRARAFAMFWRLPDHLTLGELQDDARRAMEIGGGTESGDMM